MEHQTKSPNGARSVNLPAITEHYRLAAVEMSAERLAAMADKIAEVGIYPAMRWAYSRQREQVASDILGYTQVYSDSFNQQAALDLLRYEVASMRSQTFKPERWIGPIAEREERIARLEAVIASGKAQRLKVAA